MSCKQNTKQIFLATLLKYSLAWNNLLPHGICTYICIFVIEQGFSNNDHPYKNKC